MKDGIEIKLDEASWRALERTLTQLGKRAATRVLKRAAQGALKSLVAPARAKVPRRYGLLRKSLGTTVKYYRQSGTVFVAMGPRPGWKTPIVDRRTGQVRFANPQMYAHLVERGTRRAAAHPFLRPVWDAQKVAIVRTFCKKLLTGFDVEARKLVAKYGRRKRAA